MDPKHPSVKLLKRAILAPIPLALLIMIPIGFKPDDVTLAHSQAIFSAALAVLLVSVINYSYFNKAIRDTAKQ